MSDEDMVMDEMDEMDEMGAVELSENEITLEVSDSEIASEVVASTKSPKGRGYAFRVEVKPQTQIVIPHPDPMLATQGEAYAAARFRQDFRPDDHPQPRVFHGPGYYWTDDDVIAEYLGDLADNGNGTILREGDVSHARKVWEKVESLYRSL